MKYFPFLLFIFVAQTRPLIGLYSISWDDCTKVKHLSIFRKALLDELDRSDHDVAMSAMMSLVSSDVSPFFLSK